MLFAFRKSFRFTCYGLCVLGSTYAIGATPNLHGQAGYINMPSASVEADGTFSVGYSYDSPYGELWASSTFLPFLQVTGRYVSVNGIPGFTNIQGAYGYNYGRYKDKVLDVKLRLMEESSWIPSLAFGATDLQGAEHFKGHYFVATKTFGGARNIEASIGYGQRRPDGAFAGLRWTPEGMPHWSLIAEYDANDYSKDFRASETFAGERIKGPAVGVEYRWGWLGLRIARHTDHSSINAYVSIPFAESEFVPKIYEPGYFRTAKGRSHPSMEQWRKDSSYTTELIDALAKQDYQNIRIELKGHTLSLALTNSRISNLGRAVGRAVRTAMTFAPADIRGIHVTYTKLEQPIATYEFFNLEKLSDYLTGRIPREQFLQSVSVRYATRDDIIETDQEGLLIGVKDDSGMGILIAHDGDAIQARSVDREANRLKIVPKLGFFFNDPSGALRYDLTAFANYDRRLGQGLYLNSAMGLTLAENVSGVTQPSNSLLPHVRTDVAEYKRGDRMKLYRLLLNKYFMPSERWYARASAGIYEEMYRGVGGQVLYLPKDSRWSADLTVDALQQRDFQGWFGKQDYQTVTALAALHYRLPMGMTATARAGQFLAKDVGVRAELKRRFRSGIEVGAWYSRTNGNDITAPGTPSSPYHDKGIFLSLPLSTMLPNDTQAQAGFMLSPWTRDVGQMVASPGDLYEMMEGPRRDMTSYDGLGNFSERPDEQNLPAVNPPPQTYQVPWNAFRMRLQQSASAMPDVPDAAKTVGLAAGSVFLASRLDNRIDSYVSHHQDSSLIHGLDRFGKAAPIALLGAAGAAFALGDDTLANTGLIAMESVLASVGASLALKYAVDRARPSNELGTFAKSPQRSDASFPSNHTALAFGAITPFAQQYDAPWLYGVGVLTGMGRIAGRDHWFSDNVASGVIGYGLGTWLWNSQRDPAKGGLAIQTGIRSASITWRQSY